MASFYRFSFRRARRAGRVRRLLAFCLIILLPLYAIYNFQLYPGISQLAAAAAQNEIEALIAASFSQQMAAAAGLYDDLVTITFRADGGISGVTCHMAGLNAARNELLLAVLGGISARGEIDVLLPLGNLLGGEALSGRGPRIPIRILLAQGARAHMESELVSAGINQTLYRVMFSVTVELTILTPSRPTQKTLCESFCVAETLIVGEVPDALTQINRLTEEVSEEDIDDVNDFGAQL